MEDTVNRYQRRLLYGGGMVISIMLAAATCVLLYSMARDEIARRYADFAVRKLLVQLEFQARDFAVRTFIAHEEAVWPTRESASPALIATFAAQHGRVVLQGNPHFAPVLALGDVTPQQPSDTFGRYLALANEMSYRAGAYFKLQSQAMSGYLYSPSHDFIVFIPAPGPDSTLQTHDANDVRRLIGTIAPSDNEPGQSTTSDVSATSRLSWLVPALDPIQHQQVIRLVATAFDNGKPFATLISNLPTRSVLAKLPVDQYDTVSFMVDGNGQVLLHTRHGLPSENSIYLALHTLPTLHSEQPVAMFRDGMFIISQGIQGTDWTLIHTFSWGTLIVALWPKLAACVATLLLVIGLIWIALVWLDRKVFIPAWRRSQRIVESENLNRTMITTAPFGFALMGLHDKAVLLQNDVMRAYDAQIQGDEPLHRKLMRLFDPDPAAPEWQHDLETAIAMKDDTTSDLLVSLMRTRYQGNDVVLCNFTDITARKNTERKLDEARRAADTANEAKSAFLATMSHEIRTPLNAILGNLELLDRSPLLPEQSERLNTITSSSYALLDTISSVLDFSKIESGEMPIETLRFDLADLIRQIGAMFAPIVAAKGIQFDCVIDDALASHYLGDPTRIRQIVTNLLSNAVKFTAQGDITLEVYLGGDTGEDSPIVVGVSDTGVGITLEQQRVLFQPFAQADSSVARRFGGTGLGLALCKRLTELMHGTIAVKSELGVGSTFMVTLPLRVATPADHVLRNTDAMPRPIGHIPDREHPLRMLVVDDHPANRVLIQEQMKTLGYQTDVSEDGHHALQCFAQARYDVVMTDLSMPGMDGYTLAQTLRSQGVTIPIIAITASASITEHERCAAVGMDAVLVRPILLDTIDRLIRQLVSRTVESDRPIAAPQDLAYGPLPAKVHALMQQTLQQSMEALSAALDQGDWKSVRDHLHALRGSFALIGELETADSVRQMEELAANHDQQALKTAMRVFAERASSVLDQRPAV
ncbi:hybrid sensor histidine kinase/response regulator [Dyella nitratireducens]|uniref:histidine kinase n=1 Tax=Dyella nitratireducens TaxID=1849580 RepID=A0ABQ1FKR9_9GAMM|nr:hybrid sensor histidine kinase/response regulator [Dyella nitratireducens]GGA18839.1 hybrid sensor histidine kinase/response regulator [Dyella nitratireducens]GLQ44601.1 hybrid sensor histidine kinase/response regulator [Dyella nitratireducens]